VSVNIRIQYFVKNNLAAAHKKIFSALFITMEGRNGPMYLDKRRKPIPCSGSHTGAADSAHHARPPQDQRTARPENTRSERERRKWAGSKGKNSALVERAELLSILGKTLHFHIGRGVPMLEQFPDILTVKDLQDILSIGRSKAYAILHSGELQYITIGRQIRIPKKYLLDYLQRSSYNTDMKSGIDPTEGRVYVS